MPTAPDLQNPDSRQGGEGTTSFNRKSVDALTKTIGKPGDDHERVVPIDEGTK